MKSVYKLYRDRLVGISGRSRSLYSKSISKRQAYNLGKLFEADADEAKNFIDFLWSDTRRKTKLLSTPQMFAYIKGSVSDTPARDDIKRILETESNDLRRLKREVEELEKETGRYELFVGYPFVEGIINRDILVKAPLLLFPARINIDKGIELELLKEEPVLLNKVFILAYAKEMRINVDDLVLEFEHIKAEMPNIGRLLEYLKKFDVVFKYSPGKKQITDIEKEKPRDFRTDDIEIRHYCVLGRYPLANSIYYDYNQLEKKKLSNPAIDALLNNKEVKYHEKKQPGLYNIHHLDYAQEQAVIQANNSANLVIYGPPGTGKSQTIVNMITDSLCKNKSVLVVSQKRAALEVVYNRLGYVNNKIMILPDPEKSKHEFYEKVRAKHQAIMEYKPVFDAAKYDKVTQDIAREMGELESISRTLFTVRPFGLSLQQMYTLSYSIAKGAPDSELYKAMLASDIIKLNYPELAEAVRVISDKNKAKLFYNHLALRESNPLVDYIKTDLDMHTLAKVRSFIDKLLTKDFVPFNIAAYPYSRYMLVYKLESHNGESLKPLADMITRIENPGLVKRMRACAVPPLWLGYPYFRYSYVKRRGEILKRLSIAANAVKKFTGEFELLKTVLEPQGLAMVIDSIVYGNDKFLRKLMAALDDYVTVRDMKITFASNSPAEIMIMEFALRNTRNRAEYFDCINKILPVRVYHEVVKEEKEHEQELSKTIIFNDLRNRVMSLKKDQRALAADLANDNFNNDYKEFFEKQPEDSKNFLHQINKQRDLWPVRKLMEFFEPFLMRMFPCWLLSPEAVSSILPLSPGLFDTVLFDEASQIFIESSIPAVYRGKHIVVSGDNKQLRPTSVFVKRYLGDDTYISDYDLNTQAVMEVESLLDLATSRLKSANLTYHYRSKYEELINFSNYAFYSGKLQIAPNIGKNRHYLPIERIKVNCLWRDRRNREEADAVAALVKRLLHTRKNRETIGIVTFNSEQEELIKDVLDAEAEKSDVFKREYLSELNRKDNNQDVSIFVKNLENVQGDERDIIIFSVAYARDDAGKLNAQFGSLSMAGGENRLNVAVTRAKEKVYIVTSVEPEEFVTIETAKNNGPKLLKKYLQYARAIHNRNTAEARMLLESLLLNPVEKRPALGAFEAELQKELEKAGFTVEANLGNADYKVSLALYDNDLDRYILGLECDYAAHRSSDSVMERDVYRSDFLESRGWKIMRVWSRDWWLNRPALIKAVEKEFNARKKFLIEEEERAKTQPKSKQPRLVKKMSDIMVTKKKAQ